MTKTVIFCADGTWNGPGEPDSDDKSVATNVFKLFLNLDGKGTPGTTRLENEQELALTDPDGNLVQIAKYLNGVGDSDNFLVKALGGTIGAGLITRIVRGYTFVSRNYTQSDRIFLVGFSRGAYTARALAGLIATKGLLDATKLDLSDKEEAYRLGSAVWYAYRQAALRASTDLLGRLEETVLDLPRFLERPPADVQLLRATIDTVAVWDTVGALGIPEFNMQLARIDAFRFADTKLSAAVQHGFQAIAVDEQRADFAPTFWDRDDRVTQVLFPGAHADVGGGYPVENNESGLSDGALKWMTAALTTRGVRFSPSPVFIPKPDCKGIGHSPWAHHPWLGLPKGERVIIPGLALARSLLDRMAAGEVFVDLGSAVPHYDPSNLASYLVGGAPAPGIDVV
jgi:uncharacterized protein (DUF2235 family)